MMNKIETPAERTVRENKDRKEEIGFSLLICLALLGVLAAISILA